MTPSEILANLQSILSAKYQTEDRDDDEFIDVPYVQDVDDEYRTHVKIDEQEKEKKEKKETPPEEPEVPEEPEPPEKMGGETSPGGKMPMGGEEGMPGGMGMMGMGTEEEPKEPKEIGRIYELKRIYARLVAIESQLSTSSDIILLKLRKKVSQSIELFELLASNLDSYKDKMDDIIIMFYKFLSLVYDILRKYYEAKKNKDKEEMQT